MQVLSLNFQRSRRKCKQQSHGMTYSLTYKQTHTTTTVCLRGSAHRGIMSVCMTTLLRTWRLQYSFSPKRCSIYTKSFFVILSVEVNYARGMWACHFGKHSKFSTMHCRKCNFMLIDIKVEILLTFLESMNLLKFLETLK